MNTVRIEAPAKLNLYLHVTGKRSDGYHILDSFIVFADDVVDVLHISEAENNKVYVNGPFSHLVDAEDNNLLDLMDYLEKHSMQKVPLHITLEKNIPVGAGLGGGTSDVAALLKHLIAAWSLSFEDEMLEDLLISLGADVPACFEQKALYVNGIGEQITKINSFPEAHAVLIYPNQHVSTKAIFTSPYFTFGAKPNTHIPFQHLHQTTNDLTATAIASAPEIQDVLETLEHTNAFDIVRMSGTGSCCFGLTQDASIAADMAQEIQAKHPKWWVKASRLS